MWSSEYDKYVLIDVDKKSIYEDKKTPLNLLELSELVNSNQDFNIRDLARHDLVDWSGFKSNKTGQLFCFFELLNYSAENQKKQLVQRLFRVPMISQQGQKYLCIFNEGQHNFFDEKLRGSVLLSKVDFQKKFYN